jgi:hypothetical protein
MACKPIERQAEGEGDYCVGLITEGMQGEKEKLCLIYASSPSLTFLTVAYSAIPVM